MQGDSKTDKQSPAEKAAAPRLLGVVEAITAVQNQCPHGAVRNHAQSALAAIQQLGAEAMREQAYLVFSTIRGWRGERADLVRRSLQHFLATQEKGEGKHGR